MSRAPKAYRKSGVAVRIGIDIGRVIIDSSTADLLREVSDAHCKECFLAVPAVSGALREIRRLVDRVGADNVWIISACNKRVEAKARAWLENRCFFARTGVWRDHLYFCRYPQDKVPMAHRFRLTHFVDDDFPRVLTAMPEVEHRVLFRPEDPELRRRALPGITTVWTWRAAIAAILETAHTRRTPK